MNETNNKMAWKQTNKLNGLNKQKKKHTHTTKTNKLTNLIDWMNRETNKWVNKKNKQINKMGITKQMMNKKYNTFI